MMKLLSMQLSKVWGEGQAKIHTGYINLKNHLKSCLGQDFEQTYLDIVKSCKQKGRFVSDGFVNERQREVFKILNWIVQQNQLLCEIDNEIIQDMLNVSPYSARLFKIYILSLTPLVEKAIAEQLPDKFELVCDGWTTGIVHYTALFASYVNNAGIQKVHLLALATMLNEEELGAQQHGEFIEATLALYSKTLSNGVVLIADNCNTSRKISNNLAIPLLGRASHYFNLDVNKWISEHPRHYQLLGKINGLMMQLCNLKNPARL
jgi:hypothetical protein